MLYAGIGTALAAAGAIVFGVLNSAEAAGKRQADRLRRQHLLEG
jgi:hypothetical protein